MKGSGCRFPKALPNFQKFVPFEEYLFAILNVPTAETSLSLTVISLNWNELRSYLFTWSAVLRSSLTFKNFLTCAIVNRDEQRMYFRTSSLTGGSWSELSLKQNEMEFIHVVHFVYKPRVLTAILKRSSRRAAEHPRNFGSRVTVHPCARPSAPQV